ncbi:hypothetical protein GE061_008165 [Apolygus lucorum]|uniref:Peptidase S1 domain-containing protein n=1 Tax=Apolygus lucorum TaxID=248454 RepID=A0A8S9WP28_APOLU|nr:hypothetical protein GE061_008165 [Apolygus lucorum]
MSTILPNLVRLTIESRKKRILYGQQGWEKDRDYYQSFRYYVFLARWPPGAMIMQQFHVDFDIVQESTWVCLQHSNKESKRYLYLFGQGDSGGPVTCDNAYFAVVSMIQDDISMAGPIAHTTFENAAEFRDNFMRWIDRFETDKEGEDAIKRELLINEIRLLNHYYKSQVQHYNKLIVITNLRRCPIYCLQF